MNQKTDQITGAAALFLGGLTLAAVFNAHGRPILSLDAFRIWFKVMGEARVTTTLFALVILIVAMIRFLVWLPGVATTQLLRKRNDR